jgi:hypothetical protein
MSVALKIRGDKEVGGKLLSSLYLEGQLERTPLSLCRKHLCKGGFPAVNCLRKRCSCCVPAVKYAIRLGHHKPS